MSLSNQEHHGILTKIDDSIFYGPYDEFSEYVYKFCIFVFSKNIKYIAAEAFYIKYCIV